ncbi:hypothetical protein BDY24DRAFT_396386 [Mrakia frigida]|uniref:uncharacterized protein n=1 Tax=Mrakia frigida TaxID=29902 RepID=UPI003FCC23DA
MLLNFLPVFLLAEVMSAVQAAPLLQDGVKSLFDRAGGGHPSWGGSARRGGKFPEIGSPEWKALYPPLDVPPTDMPQAWLDALRSVEAQGLIPPLSVNPISTLWPDGSRSYGDLSGISPEICNNGLGCGSPLDTSVAPEGMLGVSQDDGPLGPGVRLYEYFEAQNISATHFYVGSNVVRNYGIFLQARNIPGQHFAVHTWSHQYTTSLTNEQVVAEIGWTMQILADNNFGLIPAHWRPPYGDVDNRVRAIVREVFGLKTITWNPDPQDYFVHVGLKSKQAVKDEFEARVRGPKSPGLIPLEHVTSVEAVDIFIETYPLFLEEGWNVTNIPDLWSEAWYKNSPSGEPSTRLDPGVSIVSPRRSDGTFAASATGGGSSLGQMECSHMLLWAGVMVGAVGAWKGRSGRMGALVGAVAIWGLVSTWKH